MQKMTGRRSERSINLDRGGELPLSAMKIGEVTRNAKQERQDYTESLVHHETGPLNYNRPAGS